MLKITARGGSAGAATGSSLGVMLSEDVLQTELQLPHRFGCIDLAERTGAPGIRAGTRTAGEFLTNPSYFKEGLEGAPPDWHRKKMQIVLSTHVMSGLPGPPQVVAIHFW